MPTILCLETATKLCSVALTRDGQILWNGTPQTGSELVRDLKATLAMPVEPELQFQPEIISLATSPSSSGGVPNRLRSVILAGLIGLLVGIIVTFVWRGSPAGRAANP